MKCRALYSSLVLGLVLSAAQISAPAQLVISNNVLSVSFNPATGLFSITDFASGRLYIPQGSFNETNGMAALVGVPSAAFGQGQGIQFAHPDGNCDVIMVYSNLPFALFQSTLTNASAQTVVSNQIHTLVVQMDMSEPVGNLISMGTGGLTTPGGGAGSFMWLATADPQTRNGIIGAWLTTDRGSGSVSNRINGSLVQMDARLDYGRLQFLPGQTNLLEVFVIGYFDDARNGLETWANAVAQNYNIHLNPQPDGFSTYPAVPYTGAGNATETAALADFVKTNLALFGFSVIQIDSGWQAGPSTINPNDGKTIGARDFLSNNPTGPYPAGMAPTAAYLANDGLTAGIWFSICGSSATDPFFTNHPDWFVQTTNGTPYWVDFAGACLDATSPGARNYISNYVYQIANVWGYKYFKTDGFWAGCGVQQKYVSSQYTNDGMGDAVFADPSQPNIQAFRDGLKLVRQAAGPNVYFDGCNIGQNMRSYGGAFGLVDGIRIGPDNAASWGSGSGTGSGWLRSTEFGSRHYFLNGRVWYNDPDTVYVRDGTFSLAQAQTIASWYGVSGQLALDGDWIPGLSAPRLDILKRILPHHHLMPRPVDYFENSPPNIWLLTQPATNNAPRRDVIGLFNWNTGANQNINVTLAHIGLNTNLSYVGFDFWSNSVIPDISGSLQLSVQPGACDIIAVRPQSGVPELLSTSRHVTQGIVDVLAESWDSTNTLGGTSQLVGNDPYEMRIVSTNNWRLQSAAVSAADQLAGVTVTSLSQSNGLARVALNSPTNRQVNWSVTFVPQPSVTLASPTNNQVFYTNSAILLSATVNDPFAPVASVAFLQGAAIVGTVSNAPYNLAISNLAVGSYNLSAVATDTAGYAATSSVAQVQVQLFVPFTVAVTPSSATVAPGGSTNYSVTVTATNNFSGNVAFGLGGLPVQASAEFNPMSVNGSGSSTLTVAASNGIASGTYNLTVTAAGGGLTNTVPVSLVVNGAANLEWNAPSGEWDTNTANWLNLGTGLADVFQQGDSVLFNDAGGAFPNITVGIPVQPSSVTVNANATAYNISGAGKITGATGIEKDGTDSLLISTANDFTGAVTINSGTVIAGSATALGANATAVVINNGGTLDIGGINLTGKPVLVSGPGFNNAGAIVNNSGIQQTHGLGSVTLQGNTTFGGTTRWDMRGGAAALSTGNQPCKITKTGPNQFSLVGISVDSSLGDIDVQQGMFAVQTTTSQVGNPTNTITVRTNAILETWALNASPLNKNIVLNAGAIVTNENGASIISGPVVLQGNDFIGAANGATLTFNNVISGAGNLVKTALGTVVLSATNTYTGGTTVSNGTLELAINGSIAGIGTVTINSGATLQPDTFTFAPASGQTLAGSGTVNGTLDINGGATVAPGTATGPGTLTAANGVVLQGTAFMKLNKSARTNDVISTPANILMSGTLALTNLSGALAATDTFKLFNSPALFVSGPLMKIVPAIPAVNLAWATNTFYVDGILRITNAPTPPPRFVAAASAGGNALILNGTNGVAAWPYQVLASTNLALPLTNWMIVSTNAFDGSGNFIFTNPNPAWPPQFYILRLQ